MIHHGTFSFLPDLVDAEITEQLRYALNRGWALSIEYTDDPHPRNLYWEMWGLPMFDLVTPEVALDEVNSCRAAHPGTYVRVNAFDSRKGRETIALSFLVQRPSQEPGLRLDRQSRPGRTIGYSLHPYSADHPSGERYRC